MRTISMLLCVAIGLLAPLAAEARWTEDYDAAMSAARKHDRNVLLLFTGSDWCHWCQLLQREVFQDDAFGQWASGDFVLVELDFPQAKQQDPGIEARNRELATRYGITGFPTVVVLGPDGEELARTGYVRGGAQSWIEDIETRLRRSQN